MDVLTILILALMAVAVPFVLPLATWVALRRMQNRVSDLETHVREQSREIERLLEQVHSLRGSGAPPVKERQERPAAPEASVAGPAPAPATEAATEAAAEPATEPATEPPPEPPRPPLGRPEPAMPRPLEPEPPVTVGRPSPPPRTVPARPAFDWESLIGVKLFSAIAGIALVIAAVFFLRYSIESGWLQPPVRVAIGVIVAIALLAGCELKAARRYPVTANALDAAAIAILFATFFAAHALWDLIPGPVTFGLLTIVTALAVFLSIRRDSLFIAVLGLLGGFATPALLSTGENQPIPLFGYLLLLNVGLAWVAHSRAWPALAWLTLIFTTLYQWGWVFRYLDVSSLPLAMGVFMLFPLVSVAAMLLGGTAGGARDARSFHRAALISSALPVLFGIYLAAVPAYGAHPALLFAFVLVIDAGLLAIALARREELMHATGALATILTLATWLTTSYSAEHRSLVLGFTAAFAVLFALAPVLANTFGRPFAHAGLRAALAGSFMLFVFPVVAASGPAAAWPMFVVLLALVLVLGARAIVARQGSLYFVAAFFAVAAQAVWSAAHLSPDLLGMAVAVYAVFGVVALIVPIAARRTGRPLQPVWGGGAVLLASVLLLLFISVGNVAPEALWALALLLAVLNAALFVESAGSGLPILSQAGSILSWFVLANWWNAAAGSVGVVPSLAVLTGLTLVTLAGHAWPAMQPTDGVGPDRPRFSHGLYLALTGHLFLGVLASNLEWALPPWPLFGALAVITLATTAAAFATRITSLHAAGAIASAVVVAIWSESSIVAPYASIAVAASVLVSVYAIGCLRLVPGGDRPRAGIGAAGVLFASEAALLAAAAGAAPPLAWIIAVHAANIAGLLWLSSRFDWRQLPILATLPAYLAVLQWQVGAVTGNAWPHLLVLAGLLFALFAAYPLVLGSRARERREPYIAVLIASAIFFAGARSAFDAGGLDWMVGVVPVAAGAVLAILVRQLLSLQRDGERDLGRLALVAGGALAFATVAIPLQLENQWITVGWALEGAALSWLYRRVPHRGLIYAVAALFAAVFIRLALNPEILLYEPRGEMRILNWYLYTYLVCAAAMFAAGWWLSRTSDRLASVRLSSVLPAAGVVLLFLLLNIEIADFYATGPTITFRFGVTVSQDLTYTIGWLAFGMLLLAAGIYLSARPARIAAVSLITVTTLKCFLYDLGSLEGLYRVASFVGLALSLAVVSLALQRFVLSKPRETG